MKNYLLNTALIAGLIGAAAAPLAASAQVFVRVGPPRPIYERRPIAPGAGYVWRNGYHRWDGARYVWTPGSYAAPPRPRAVWVQGRWMRGGRGYYWRDGYWR